MPFTVDERGELPEFVSRRSASVGDRVHDVEIALAAADAANDLVNDELDGLDRVRLSATATICEAVALHAALYADWPTGQLRTEQIAGAKAAATLAVGRMQELQDVFATTMERIRKTAVLANDAVLDYHKLRN
jgi:hypothetical protein